MVCELAKRRKYPENSCLHGKRRKGSRCCRLQRFIDPEHPGDWEREREKEEVSFATDCGLCFSTRRGKGEKGTVRMRSVVESQ